MPELVRLSISLEEPLCEKLDKMVKTSGYSNRSEYIRDMIRDRMVSEQWEKSEEVLGTITLIYNHHQRELSEKITDIQHQHHETVLASTHVHLSHEICAEMIMVKGEAGNIAKLADTLRQQRGVLHSGLTMSSSGQELK
ncbi:MAG: nickel-responsive transcriptional regulator NikR [Victivallaceae bacterium]